MGDIRGIGFKTIGCAVGMALLAGCAATSVDSESKAKSEPVQAQSSAATVDTKATTETASAKPRRKDPNEMICQRYKPTGSHRSVTRCVTRAQKTAERDSAVLGLQQAAGASLSDNAVNNAGGGTP